MNLIENDDMAQAAFHISEALKFSLTHYRYCRIHEGKKSWEEKGHCYGVAPFRSLKGLIKVKIKFDF